MIWSEIQCGIMCYVIWYGTMWRVVQCGEMCCVVCFNVIWFEVRYNVVECLCYLVRCDVLCALMWWNMTWHCVIWFDLVWWNVEKSFWTSEKQILKLSVGESCEMQMQWKLQTNIEAKYSKKFEIDGSNQKTFLKKENPEVHPTCKEK